MSGFDDVHKAEAGPTNEGNPPSYDSLFGEIKRVKAQHQGDKRGMVIGLCSVIMGSVVFLVILALMLALPVAAIIIGAIYKDDCPAERFIPIYLIVFGVFSVVSGLLSIVQNIQNKKAKDRGEEPEPNSCVSCINGVVGCFLFAWFIAGNVWIYGTHNEWSSNKDAANYCHPTLYYFAFWFLTSSYILLGVCCVCSVVTMICLFCCAACADD